MIFKAMNYRYITFNILVSMVSMGLVSSNPVSAQQRVCVITDEGAIVCGKPTTRKQQPTSGSDYRKEIGKFIFLLKGCKRSDTNIKCNFSVMNKGDEVPTNISSDWFLLVDSTGKSYPGNGLNIGGNSSNKGQSHSLTISPGIEYLGEITFESVPEILRQFPLLKIDFLNNKMNFRNISLSN
jgi:hypothetical protein